MSFFLLDSENLFLICPKAQFYSKSYESIFSTYEVTKESRTKDPWGCFISSWASGLISVSLLTIWSFHLFLFKDLNFLGNLFAHFLHSTTFNTILIVRVLLSIELAFQRKKITNFFEIQILSLYDRHCTKINIKINTVPNKYLLATKNTKKKK